MKNDCSQRTRPALLSWRHSPCSSTQEAGEGHGDFISSLKAGKGDSKCLPFSMTCLGSIQGGQAWSALDAACLSGAGWRRPHFTTWKGWDRPSPGRACVRIDLTTSESLCKVSNPWQSVVKEQHSVVWFLSWAGVGSLTVVELWVSRRGSEEPSCLRLW